MDLVDEIREECREVWRESGERGGVRDELHRLGAWTSRLPGGLARFALGQMRALWTVTVTLLRDIFRGSPVLIGIVFRGVARGARAAVRASGGAGAAAPTPVRAAAPEAKSKAPAIDEKGKEPALDEEAQLASDAPAGPPWKGRKGAAKAPAKEATKAPAKKAPVAPAAPAGKSLADLAETAGIGFLVLVLVVAFGRLALGALGDVLAPYAAGIVFVLVVVWCFAAAMVAPRADDVDEEEPVEDDEDPTENDHETAGEEPQENDPWPALREIIRNCAEGEVAAGAGGYREAKGRGARIDDLVIPLQRRGVAEAVDRKAIITLLERAEITYREQMKFRVGGKQKNAPGVHVDDLANDLGYRPRLPSGLVPDLTPQPGPSRELKSTL
ncbi:hypothetical protein ACFV27_00755 [Streptomyces antimycoticus]|uniref:hypothetical protein n=1 Tax=Streptomyces antimycoticus TaxID=68175 RepID=UPI003689353B